MMVLADASLLFLEVFSLLAIFPCCEGTIRSISLSIHGLFIIICFLGEDWSKCIGNSCLGRCGHTYEPEGPHKCSCDELCPMFRDCCRDFYSECKHDAPQLPSFIYNHGHFKCLEQASSLKVPTMQVSIYQFLNEMRSKHQL